jgi:hypothetical protein
MKHLIFLFTDHFEPRSIEEMRPWLEEYPRRAREFADAGGRPPRHAWFYDGDDPQVLRALGELCRQGLGEVELHLHHSRDTSESLRALLEARKRCWAEFGALTTVGLGARACFGVIHGKWSLDNSRGEEHCGVNNELAVLRDAGCYADFTFPAWGRMQPRRVNSIYYAQDDPDRPKSYDDGVPVMVGWPPSGDLMIFQGPGRLSGVPASLARLPGAARLADRLWLTCAMDAHLPPLPGRVDRWVRAGVGVQGRPEWVFVKVHSHGARPANYRAYFDGGLAALHSRLRDRYNDGREWRLHYATAREAYNIVKAAEAGRTGDPEQFRDFLLPPYQNTR